MRIVEGNNPEMLGEDARADAETTHARLRSIAALVVTGVVVVWVLWRTGYGTMPALDAFESIARQWPHSSVSPAFGYTLRSPLGYVVYQLAPEQSPHVYAMMHLLCLAGVALVLTAWLVRRLGVARSTTAVMVLACAPVTAVTLLWIGIYDAFSLAGWVAVLMTLRSRPVAQYLAAIVVGLQNIEQGAVGIVVLLLLPRLVRATGSVPRPLALLGGLLTGKVLLEGYLYSVGAVSGTRLSSLFVGNKLRDVLTASFDAAPMLIWSAFGGLWVLVAIGARSLARAGTRREIAMAAAAVAIWFGSAFVTEDHTRVLALTSFPALVLASIVIALRHRDVLDFLKTPAAVILLVAPPLVLWGGMTLSTGW